MSKLRPPLLLALLTLLPAQPAPAEDLTRYSPVELANGPSNVDFTGDGKKDLVVVGHRENYNAHSFEVATFYIKASLFEGSEEIWNLVPLFDDTGEKLEVKVSGGADCLLHDFRLLKGKKKNEALLILADREFGETYADEQTVAFSFYSLKVNPGDDIGRPGFYFEKTSTQVAKAKYCDVGEALQKELRLAP